jgi:hypothetical protein
MFANVDPARLSDGAWWLELVLLFTFLLHLVVMSLVVGGALVAGWAAFAGRRPKGHANNAGGAARPAWHRVLARDLARVLPIGAAAGTALGIVPLLCLQRLYGPLLYTSLILMMLGWMSIVTLLLAGYYGYYDARFGEGTRAAVAVSLGSAALLVASGWIVTGDMALTSRPELVAALGAGADPWLHLGSAGAAWPRFLHFLVGSCALAGIMVGIIGEMRSRSNAAIGGEIRRQGVRLFVVASVLQLGVGAWFLLSLPARVAELFLDTGTPDALMLATGVGFAVVAILAARRSLLLAMLGMTVSLADMVMVRQRVRTLMLEPFFPRGVLPAGSEGALLVLLVVLALASAGLVAWIVSRMVRAHPRPA